MFAVPKMANLMDMVYQFLLADVREAQLLRGCEGVHLTGELRTFAMLLSQSLHGIRRLMACVQTAAIEDSRQTRSS